MTGGHEDTNTVKLGLGHREDFERIGFSNSAGMQLALYRNGGTIDISCNGLMVNQVEGHPLQGGFDRVYLRTHTASGRECVALSGAAAPCSFHRHGAVWRSEYAGLAASMQLQLHPELPVVLRICRVQNHRAQPVVCDWLMGQDLGLADRDTLKNNEAYVCQYLDHKCLDHPVAGKVVLSRNNLHPRHPLALHCCLQGAQSASTDGHQFFGTGYKLSGEPVALQSRTLENRVRQYEFAYSALQSRAVELAPGDCSTTVFALHVLPEHPPVSSAEDLALVDELLQAALPEPGDWLADSLDNAFFLHTSMLRCNALDEAQLRRLFADPWRHQEYSTCGELYSFFCSEDTHVVLPAKEAAVERQHGSMLVTAQGIATANNTLGVTCYGYGAFGSQLSLGNTSIGRFSTVQRNSLNLERSSGLRVFSKNATGWQQLGFPSAFVMERSRIRWIYSLQDCLFEIVASATSDTLEYAAIAISGAMPALRLTWEACSAPNEFDGAPRVEWDAPEKLLSVFPARGSLLHRKFPASCLLARVTCTAISVSDATALGGAAEPYVVLDFPAGEFRLALTGHYAGRTQAVARFAQARALDWESLTAHFRLAAGSPAAAKLSDTVNWYAHNALIHFATPRGMEQYSAAAWGTRDVCQGPLECLLALGHDEQVAAMLHEVFAHQYADTGTWPQWFMFDDFREIQSREAHGDIVYWPIKALCDYIEQSGDARILEHAVCYTDPETYAFTSRLATIQEHLGKAVNHIYQSCVEGTALPCYGNGDWNDALQPADPAMKTRMTSAWTAGLAHQSLAALARVWKLAGYCTQADELERFLLRLANDFHAHVVRDGVVAGFVIFDGSNSTALMHPSDTTTGIHYRLLPINQAISSGLFAPREAEYHLALVHRHLKFPDGIRLMDKPPRYRGGLSRHFQRAETAAHFGREIGLLYVHANIRYCEALARFGRAEELLETLLVISPVAIAEAVANARPRQANLYFSSSDAEVYDRYEAETCLEELKAGRIGALAGWRLYSSGPGLYIALLVNHLFGIRRSHGSIVLDPVLPASLNGIRLCLDWYGKRVDWVYCRDQQSFAPYRVVVNGVPVENTRRLHHPYREGGLVVDLARFNALLQQERNVVEIHL